MQASTVNPPAAVPGAPRESGTTTALGAALLATCLFATFPLPTAFVSPVPLALQRLRGGWGRAILASGITVAVVLSIFDTRRTLHFAVLLLAPVLILGDAMARGRGLRRACLYALAAATVAMAAGLFVAGDRMAQQVFFEPIEYFRSQQFLDDMRSAGFPAERVDLWAADWSAKNEALKVVYPAAFLILAWMVVLLNAAVVQVYLARRDPGWLEGGEFEGMRWPAGLSVVFVLSGLLVFVVPARPLAYNVLLLLAFLFGLQGLAVVFYYVHRLAGPPFLRALVVAAILLSWPRILCLVGLLDLFLDLRKYADPPPAGGQS